MSDPRPPRFIGAYQALFRDTPRDDTRWDDIRFVALDSETTGLDPRRDRLITIGAVAVVGGDILLDDAFEVMMPVRYNTASVTVHASPGTRREMGCQSPRRWRRCSAISGPA